MKPKKTANTASELIDLWGGTSVTAERFNVLPSAVSNWRNTGFPPRLHYRIAKACKDERIAIPNNFFDTVAA